MPNKVGVGIIFGLIVALIPISVFAQISKCDSSFELSSNCISRHGIGTMVDTYANLITATEQQYGVSYNIRFRVVNDPTKEGYPVNGGDVFTEVDHEKNADDDSFVISVTWYFLKNQPEILFEHSVRHEIAHIMNGDFSWHCCHREDAEMLAEHSVLQLVGEKRYEEFLKSYAHYRGLDEEKFELILQMVKGTKPVSPPVELDRADTLAMAYFRRIADGKEHLLAYNGKIHDITGISTRHNAGYNARKLAAVVREGKPIIFFHNHPVYEIQYMFPSRFDFGSVSKIGFPVLVENPNLVLESRVVVGSKEMMSISYGLKKPLLDEILANVLAYRMLKTRFSGIGRNGGMSVILDGQLKQIMQKQDSLSDQISIESYTEYLYYTCPYQLSLVKPEICNVRPQFFLWPSNKYFLHYRGTITTR